MFQAPVSETKARNDASRSHESATAPQRELYPRFAGFSAPLLAAHPAPPRIQQTLMRRAFIQRKCSCGGTCSHCEEEKDLANRLQTKLKIGAVNDPFEREADHVAAAVMRMPVGEPPTVAAADARLQRSACGACRGLDETIQRSPAAVRGANPPQLTSATLTRGGIALPRDVRHFFEARFERDFSQVRVHTGPESNELNASLQAHAFAYENHIWLGSGHSVARSTLMAHELTHVMQQTGAAEKPAGISADMPGVVRRAPGFWYFEPPDTNGTDTHARVLGAVERANPGLLHEVPCPKGAEGLKRGQADLYMPRPMAVFGVWYGQQKSRKKNVSEQRAYPEFQNLPRNVALEHVRYAPTTSSYDPRHQTQPLNDVNSAPTEIFVGDLKPIGEESHKGVEQVQDYIDGLNTVGTLVTDSGHPSYALKASPLASLTPPQEFDVSNVGAPRETLWVKKATPSRGKVMDEIRGRIAVHPRRLTGVTGRLVFQQDPQFGTRGIYNHFWVPDPFPAAQLPRELQHLNDDQLEDVIRSLTRVPVGIQRKPLASAITHDSPRLMRNSDKEAPKGIHVKDPFDYDEWKKQLDKVSGTFTKAEKDKATSERINDVEAVSSALEGLHSVGQARNIDVPKDATRIKRLEFWSGKIPPFLGKFRKVFGAAFVNIARLFLWGREKFRTLIKSHQKEAPGTRSGPVGTIVKILFKVAKFALTTMLPQITNRLWTSLTTGVKQKLLSLIPDSITEEYEERKDQFESTIEQLSEIAEKPVLDWLKDLVAPVEKILDEVGKVAATLREVKEIVDDIKTAIKLYECATAVEGNIFGCIASFIGPALDLLIDKIVRTCAVKKTIIPHLLKLDFIRKVAPNLIADKLISFGRSLLPKGWESILADPDQSDYVSDTTEIPCDEQVSPVERAMDALARELGNDEDKIFALGELMNALGGDDLKNVTEAQVLELARMVRGLDISAQQMRDYARNLKTPPKDIPAAFRGYMEDLLRSVASGDEAPKEYDVGGAAGAGGPGKGPGSGGPGAGPGSGSGTGHGTSDGGGQLRISAQDAQYQGPATGVAQPRSLFKVIPWSPSMTAGKDATVDIIGFWDGRVWATIVGVPVSVLSVDSNVVRLQMKQDKGIIIGPDAHLGANDVLCFWKQKDSDTRNCKQPSQK